MHATVYPFHDGWLTSMSVEDDVAVLGLMQADKTGFRMRLDGVEALRADGFRQGNIILDLRAIRGRHPASEDMRGLRVDEVMEALFPKPHAAAPAHFHQAHADAVAARLARVARGDASLLLLTPSHGAELYAYCTAVTLQASTR